MKTIKEFTHKKSTNTTTHQSEITISFSSTKSDIKHSLKLFANSTTISSLSIAIDSFNKKQLQLFCKGIQKNKENLRFVSISNLSNEKPEEIAQIAHSLTSCHNIKSLKLHYVFGLDIIRSISIILSNPYLSQLSLSFNKDRAPKKEEFLLAKTLVLCRYLTSAQICLSFTQYGCRALEIAHQYNQSLFSIQSLPGERFAFLPIRQKEIKKYISEWIKLQNHQPIKYDIIKLYNYAYIHYPIFKEELKKHDNTNYTQFSSSLLAALQPDASNSLCTRSLASVCKLFFELINNVRKPDQCEQNNSTLCNLPYDIITHIITIAQQDILWRRDITDNKFNELLLASI